MEQGAWGKRRRRGSCWVLGTRCWLRRLGDGETKGLGVTKRETGRDLPGYEVPGRVCEGDREAGRGRKGNKE